MFYEAGCYDIPDRIIESHFKENGTMNARDLKPISQLAQKTGAKIILYGPPGTAKTPMMAQLTKAVALLCETGLSSVKNSNMPACMALDFPTIDQFRKWFIDPKSTDVRQFDTLVIDSLTALCDIVLKYYLDRNKHGLKAYGELLEYVMDFVQALCRMPNMNVIFICQMMTEEKVSFPQGILGTQESKPYNRPLFPGQKLERKIPHEIDEIWYVDRIKYSDGQVRPAIHTVDTGAFLARSRNGRLQPVEPPDLNLLINKINS